MPGPINSGHKQQYKASFTYFVHISPLANIPSNKTCKMSNLCQGANKFGFYVCYKYMRKFYYTCCIIIALKSFQKYSLYFYYLLFLIGIPIATITVLFRFISFNKRSNILFNNLFIILLPHSFSSSLFKELKYLTV